MLLQDIFQGTEGGPNVSALRARKIRKLTYRLDSNGKRTQLVGGYGAAYFRIGAERLRRMVNFRSFIH